MLVCLALAAASAALAPPAAAPPQVAPRWSRVDQPATDVGSFLGVGLALDATTMVVGAPHAVAGVEEDLFSQTQWGPAGSVTFYGRSTPNADWHEVQFVRPSLSNERDRFGVSVILAGDTAFIGAPSCVVGGVRAGAVFRFERVAGQWIESQVLTSSLAHDFAGFGNHLAFDGDQLLVGAPFQDGAGIDEWGHGFVFERVAAGGGDWVETGVLTPPPMPDKSWAGYRVSIEGSEAMLGLFGSEIGGNGAGAICRFLKTTQGWIPAQQILPSVQIQFSHFSYELIQRGDLLITGAYRSGPAGHHHGSVNIFRRSGPGADFVEVQRIVPPGLEFGAVMGVACALLDDGRLAAGMAGANLQSGRVGLYSPLPDGTFRLDGITYPPGLPVGASFGWKLATDGRRLAASAPTETVAGGVRGAVYSWDPDVVSFERPHCSGTNATSNPRPVLLRSQGALDAGASGVRLRLTEMPPQSVVTLLASPSQNSGLPFGCLKGPVRRVSNGPLTSDPNGGCTWWIGGTNLASGCTVGSSWTFQVQAWNAGNRMRSNALDLVIR